MRVGRVGCETAPGEDAEWTFVVGRWFIAVLPVGTHSPIIAALHALAAEPEATVETLIGLIPLSGPDEVGSFAVIVAGAHPDTAGADGIPVHAVVRGAIAVDVFSIGGSRRFTDRNIRPWLLAEFQAVTGLVIGSPLAAVAPADRLGTGTALGAGIAAGDTLFWSVAGLSVDVEDTILRPRRIVEDTVRSDTVVIERFVGAAAALPAAAVLGRYGIRLAAGDDLRLDRVYRIGRNPGARRSLPGEVLELVEVASPSAVVSSNHLEIRQDGDAVVLTDLGSTNGTLVRFSRGHTQRLRSGASLTVLPGTTVDIGDGNLIEILPAG
jgi:hypothetical protein